MSCHRAERLQCKLFGKCILLDANFFINLVDALAEPIGLNTQNWRNQLESFGSKLEKFLEKCCKCPSGNKLFTTDLIFNNEIDPSNNQSTIRQKSRFFRDVSYNYNAISRSFFSNVSSIMERWVDTVSTDPSHLNLLRLSVVNSRRLADEDVSLIIAAVIKSNEISETFVITADEELRTCLEDTYSLGNITLSSRSYVTNRLTPLTPYGFTSYLHKCCELSNDDQISFFGFHVTKNIGRDLGNRKRRIKAAQAKETFKLLQENIKIKSERGY